MKKIMGLWILLTVFSSSSLAMAQSKTSPISDEKAHEIVMTGTPDDVRKLLDSGYDVNKVSYCNTLLTEAVLSAARGIYARKHPTYALEKIKILVNAGADVNLIPCPGLSMPALHWAVSLPAELKNLEHDANEIIDEKIKNNIGECNFPGIVAKPCHEITQKEREMIGEAIKDAMQLAYSTFTPYFIEIIDFIISKGGNVNLKAGISGVSPLHLAAANPQEISLEPLKYLIKAGADLNIQDDKGSTPLFWAYGFNNNKAVDLLIEAGADKKITNKDGNLYSEVEARMIRGLMDNKENLIFK